jgi:hypothetical protein
MRSAPVHHRGVALILVLTTLAILTAVGVDFSYSSRVSLKLAENLRDGTRAEFMARSAINLSRLLLHFQKQLDQMGGQLGSVPKRARRRRRSGPTRRRPPAPPRPRRQQSRSSGSAVCPSTPTRSALLTGGISRLEAARSGERAAAAALSNLGGSSTHSGPSTDLPPRSSTRTAGSTSGPDGLTTVPASVLTSSGR